MPAQINETVLKSFTIDDEGFRNLDAILIERCREINDQIVLEYEVKRKDALNYTTQNVEDICGERNGKETRIEEVKISTRNEEKILSAKIIFNEKLDLSITGEDRAKVLLLTSDIRNLAHDRMKGVGVRARIKLSKFIFVSFGIAVAIMYVMLGYTLISQARNDAAYSAYESEYAKANDKVDTASRRLLSQGDRLANSGTADEKLGYLVEKSVQELQDNETLATVGKYPKGPDEVLNFPTILLIPLTSPIVAVVVYGLARLIVRTPASIYLIGDEIIRQARAEKRRERLVWGIGATVALGVLSSLLATWLAS